MYSSPNKDTTNKNQRTPTVRLKGLFKDGIWHCNCKPHLPAAHFLVRKEGPNKGRWFYTCQEPKDSGCRFFLWDDDAVGREMRAVISNSRSEVAAALQTVAPKDANTPDKMTIHGHVEASNRQMADLVKQEEDEFGDWPLSVNDEMSLVGAIRNKETLQSRPSCPETPRKAVRVDMLNTPSSKRKRDEANALPTPVTGRADQEDVFTSPSLTRLKGGIWDGNERSGLMSPSVTPTPARFREVNQPLGNSDTISDPKDYNITQEVMEVLRDQSLDEETSVKLKQVLNKHALKNQGIARGRDITRIALRAKDIKIAELQQRVTSLENEREMDKLVVEHFKSDMTQSISRRGRALEKPPDE